VTKRFHSARTEMPPERLAEIYTHIFIYLLLFGEMCLCWKRFYL